MEPFEAFFDEEWVSLSNFFSTENSECNLVSNYDEILPNIISPDEENPFSNQVDGVHFHQDGFSYTLESLDFYTMCYNNGPVFLEDCMQETVQLNQESCNNQLNDKDNAKLLPTEDSCNEKPAKILKKRSRVSKKSNVQKTKKPRKTKKGKQNEEKSTIETNVQSSNTGISEEVSNPSQKPSEESLSESKELLNLSGKARKTKRGSATDPQSLYARRRREKINEKLKILQNLVPNGTKVDLSTMLEEAVHYVKFLQLQIKLLSSDEMWMYSPIAYNGMDMDFYQNTVLPNLLSLHN